MIKRHIILAAATVTLAISGTVAAQTGVLPGINNNAQPTKVLEQAATTGRGTAPADQQKTSSPVTVPDDTSTTDSTGGGTTNPTPVTPSEPVDTPTPTAAQLTGGQEPAVVKPYVPPAPTLTGHTIRFVDVSPASAPNTKAAQYCDYHYSDGSTVPTHMGTIGKPAGFAQPISSYTESNPPGAYTPC